MSEKRRLGEIGSARGDAFLSRGRASRSNEAGRVERLQTEAFDHGWSGSKDGEPPRVETTLTAEGEDHHLAQRKPRSRVRSISESVPGLRARLHLLRGSKARFAGPNSGGPVRRLVGERGQRVSRDLHQPIKGTFSCLSRCHQLLGDEAAHLVKVELGKRPFATPFSGSENWPVLG